VGKDQLIQAVLWDSDGVLVDTESVFYETTRDVLASKGIDLPREYWARHYLGQGQNSHEIALELGLPANELEPLLKYRNAVFRERLQTGVSVRPQVHTTLSRLQPMVRLAMVTAATRDHIELTHRDSQLLPFFELVLTFEDYGKPKPSPAGYLMALERLGLPADRCLAVEDSPRGVRAAAGAGLQCVLVPTDLTDVSLCRDLCQIEPTVAGVLRHVFCQD
jgi:HAD superfamily hydrolase (TIGR01509 family)